MTEIKLENISRKYKNGELELFALKNINLSIKKGSFVVILGPSGSGKSTLLNIIGGIDTPSEGQIWVGNRNISTLSQNQLAEYRAETVGFIFQNYNLIPTLTVEENLSLMKEICHSTITVEEILKKVGLDKCLNRFPSQLSGGEQQRTAIARALIKNPEILLCDEPTGALDSKTGCEVFETIVNLSKAGGKTTIVVTHNNEIAKTADVVLKLKSGMLVEIQENSNPCSVSEIEW